MLRTSRTIFLWIAQIILLSAGLYGSQAMAQATDVDCTGCVNTRDIADESIKNTKIAKYSVQNNRLANNAVSTGKIRDDAVTAAKINSAQVQERVDGICSVGSFIAAIADDGSVTCETGTDDLFNTSYGDLALANAPTGDGNTGLGAGALQFNAAGYANTAVGVDALGDNTDGILNTATGTNALLHNTTGHRNVAIGMQALVFNTIGHRNIAVGMAALNDNTEGNYNTAVGSGGTLSDNVTGSDNTAIGAVALHLNTTGVGNTAVGAYSLRDNVTGQDNIAIGAYSGQVITGGWNIAIANPGVVGESNTMRIGNANQHRAFISAINGVTTDIADAVSVVIDSNGQLGTVSSSRRYKQDINEMGNASDRLMQLNPVTFRYKDAYANGEQPLDYGLIAEEVAAVFPDLVVFNAEGQPETVKYRLLSSLLLNELQKQDARLKTLNGQVGEIDDLKAELAELGKLVQQLKQ